MAKKPASMGRLANWYFGNFCVKCGRIESEKEEYGRLCHEKLHGLKDAVGVGEMTHQEYVGLVKGG
jgi:hypothetical protein